MFFFCFFLNKNFQSYCIVLRGSFILWNQELVLSHDMIESWYRELNCPFSFSQLLDKSCIFFFLIGFRVFFLYTFLSPWIMSFVGELLLLAGYYQGPPVMAPPQYAAPPPRRQPGFLEGWWVSSPLSIAMQITCLCLKVFMLKIWTYKLIKLNWFKLVYIFSLESLDK